jgi:hypothetical protein
MTRREFCRHIALLAVGAMALTEQIDALERTYLVSSEHLSDSGIASVEEFFIGFNGMPSDTTAELIFTDGVRSRPISMNTRASIRWIPTAPMSWITSVDTFRWIYRNTKAEQNPDLYSSLQLDGWVSWLDSDGRQRTTPLAGNGTLR